jgi:FkbM family methyltransferase
MSAIMRKAAHAMYVLAARNRLVNRGPSRRAFEAAYFFYKRYFEAGSPKRLAPFIVEGSTVIDAGANIGFFTLPFAQMVGPRGRVIALEPEPTNFRRLAARVQATALANRVTLLRAAAAERSGRELLAINPDHPGDHKIASDRSDGGVEVEAHALDDLVAAHPGPPVSLIKIDVQGAESRVLEGATGLLRTDGPALFVEVDPVAGSKMGCPVDRLLAWLEALGYQGYIWSGREYARKLSAREIEKRATAAGYLDILFRCERSVPTG